MLKHKYGSKIYERENSKTNEPHKFESPKGSYSVSDIQDYIKFIINEYETLTKIRPIHIYVKDGYKLEPETPETVKLITGKKI